MSPEQVKKALEVVASGDEKAALALLIDVVASAAGGGEPASDPPADPLATTADPPADDPADPMKEPLSALSKKLGFKSADEFVADYARLSKESAERSEREASIELDTRRGLIAEFIALGVEFPSTAWVGDAKDRKPVRRLMAEPLADMRARLALHKKQAPRAAHEPPSPGDAPVVVKLSKDERDYCTKHGLTEQEFADRKARSVRKAT